MIYHDLPVAFKNWWRSIALDELCFSWGISWEENGLTSWDYHRVPEGIRDMQKCGRLWKHTMAWTESMRQTEQWSIHNLAINRLCNCALHPQVEVYASFCSQRPSKKPENNWDQQHLSAFCIVGILPLTTRIPMYFRNFSNSEAPGLGQADQVQGWHNLVVNVIFWGNGLAINNRDFVGSTI